VDSQRRESLVRLTRCAAALMVARPRGCAAAFSSSDISQKDAGAGVKAAVQKVAKVAVELLGKQNGF